MEDLTVGISVYKNNNPEFLVNSLNSVTAEQKYKPSKLIIVIDGEISSDLEVLINSFVESCPIKTLVLKNKTNKGLTYSLNKMISACETKYFARMDADDVSLDLRFEKQVCFLNKNPNIDILGSRAIDIDENGKRIRHRSVPLLHKKIIKTLPYVNTMIHPSVIFRMSSIKRIGGYNEQYRTSQDYFYWFYCQSKNLTFANLKEALILYRIDNNYGKRKNVKYRINDVKLKLHGFRITNQAFYKYVLIFVPLFVWLVPVSLISALKQLDPREK